MVNKLLRIFIICNLFFQLGHAQVMPIGIQIPNQFRPSGIPTNQATGSNQVKPRVVTVSKNEKRTSDSLITSRQIVENTNFEKKDTALVSLRKKIFGYSIFNNQVGVFEPNLKIATPKTYVIGPDDELIVDINGYSEEHYNLTVSPDGYVKINRIGNVYVAGLTIEEAKARIIHKLSQIFVGLRREGSGPSSTNLYATISLGNIRTVNVSIQGEVMFPGTYSVSSLSRVMNVLYFAGGPNERGTFRNIQIIRNKKVVGTIDLYDFLTSGIQKNDINVQDQDIIKVGVFENRIELKGSFKRTGLFEVKPGENLAHVIQELGGGFDNGAFKDLVKITRYTNRERKLIDLSMDLATSFSPQSGDEIVAEAIFEGRFENRVTIAGEVFRPGNFSLESNPSLLKLIQRAGGVKENAFLERITIERINDDLSPVNLSVNLKDLLAGKIKDIILKREDKVSVFSIFDLRENYTVTIRGEINLNKEKLDNSSSSSTKLEVQDAQNSANNTLEEDVAGKGPLNDTDKTNLKLVLPFVEKMTVEDIILKAGGLKESAATGFVEIVRRKKNIGLDNPDLVNSQIAEIIRFSIAKNLSLDKSASTFELMPFDEVFIRSSPNYETQQFVSVKGQVLFPGVYGIEKKDQRLSEIISRAGGLNKQAYPEGARLIRKIILSDTEKNRKKEQLEEIADNYDNTTIKNDPVLNKEYETIGIDLVQAIENPLGENDLILNDGDYVEIPKEPQTVKISGEVLYPNSVKYLNSKIFSDYISEAGGYTSNSVRKRAYVLYSNGSVKRVKSFLFMRINPKIEKGAEIIIPAKSKSVNYSQQIISLVSVLTGTVTSIIGIITLIKATAN